MEAFDTGFLALIAVAFLAGAVDAVVGGGGLIQIPALFAVHPGESPATLFGTNKCASVVGTSNAAWRYARRVAMPWRTILPAAAAAFAFSYVGAAAVAWLGSRPEVAGRKIGLTGFCMGGKYACLAAARCVLVVQVSEYQPQQHARRPPGEDETEQCADEFSQPVHRSFHYHSTTPC
mgnify:CR=1 FL=1